MTQVGSVRLPVGLALAGGAPGGAIYEIGALRALDLAIPDLDLTSCSSYVGVSAGAFLAACLANGLSPKQQVRAIVKAEPGEHPFIPETFFRPHLREFSKRASRAPRLAWTAVKDYAFGRDRLTDSLTRVGKALPVGLFDNEPMRRYVEKVFSIKGRTDRFEELNRRLTVVATDLESGCSQRFGFSGLSDVPISVALQASTALPGLYPPVEIGGRTYVDGILLKTMHASVALEAGAKLVFCINPLVPVDTRKAVARDQLAPNEIVENGLPSVLSQTVRTLIHSRLRLGIRSYATQFPGAKVILIEPARDDYRDFFSNIFSFASRLEVCDRAFHATRKALAQRRSELDQALAPFGLTLDHQFLDDPEVDLWSGVGLEPRRTDRWSMNVFRQRSRAKAVGSETRLRTRAPSTEVTQGLSAALDRLETRLEQRGF